MEKDRILEPLKIFQIDNEKEAKVLFSVSKEVRKIDEKIVKLVNDLKLQLERIGSGFGIAAPQVGVLKRVFILLDPITRTYYELINPKLVAFKGGLSLEKEACFSVYYAKIDKPKLRYNNIVVQYTTLENKVVTKSLSGWIARAFQHELDHLNGKLIHIHDPQKNKNLK